MNIGMILDKTFPPDPRVENEAMTLINAGHTVHLFCFQSFRRQKQSEVINGVNVTRAKLPRLLYKLSALAYTVPCYHYYYRCNISKFIHKNNIQAIHIHDMQIARSVFSVKRKFNLPVVLDLHENRPEIMKYYAHTNTFLGRLLINPDRWKNFEYKYIKKADKVIVVTTEAKEYYLKERTTGREKFHVVPNSVRPAFYNDYREDEKIIRKYEKHFTILYIGETGLRRGLETAINALEYLIPVIPNIKIVFVGASKTDDILKRLVTEKNWNDYIDFTGWQDFHLFQSYILASDIGICPIYRNVHHDTTYANKLFQYLSFGKPVVVSNCTAQENLVNDFNCGLVFKDGDVKEFSDKVISLYRDREFYQRLSGNAKSAIREKLNWNILSKELITLYEEIRSGA